MAVALATSDRLQLRVAGRGFIAGTPPGLVTVQSVPSRRELDLFVRGTRQWVRRTWSRPNGTYQFSGLDVALRYDVVGRDPARQWQDVIKGEITPWSYPT